MALRSARGCAVRAVQGECMDTYYYVSVCSACGFLFTLLHSLAPVILHSTKPTTHVSQFQQLYIAQDVSFPPRDTLKKAAANLASLAKHSQMALSISNTLFHRTHSFVDSA